MQIAATEKMLLLLADSISVDDHFKMKQERRKGE